MESLFDDIDRMNTSVDAQELDDYMEDSLVVDRPSTKGALPASKQDKDEAEANGGKVKTDEDKDKEAEERIKKAQKERKAVQKDLDEFLGSEDDEDEVDTETEEQEEETEEEEEFVEKQTKTKASKELEQVIERSELESFAESLYKIGVLTPDSDEDEPELPSTDEELVQALNREKTKGAEIMIDNFFSKYGEDYYNAFQEIFVKGVDPKEYLSRFNSIQSFKDMDMTDATNQETVMGAYLKKTGWDEDAIEAKIRKAKINSDLEEESKQMHKALIKSEEKELGEFSKKQAETKQHEQALKKLWNDNIDKILDDKLKTKDFDGIPLSPDKVKNAKEFMRDKAWKLRDGSLITSFEYALLELDNPVNHSLKVKLGLLLSDGFEPGKPLKLNLDSIKKSAASAKTKEIFTFTKGKATKSKRPTSRQEEDSEEVDSFSKYI